MVQPYKPSKLMMAYYSMQRMSTTLNYTVFYDKDVHELILEGCLDSVQINTGRMIRFFSDYGNYFTWFSMDESGQRNFHS